LALWEGGERKKEGRQNRENLEKNQRGYFDGGGCLKSQIGNVCRKPKEGDRKRGRPVAGRDYSGAKRGVGPFVIKEKGRKKSHLAMLKSKLGGKGMRAIISREEPNGGGS